MKSIKRGFTLIELLVVIAIIAILAAILFPVFAQAKAAAKDAAALSNTKQLDLGVIMYENDYDDTFPLGTEWSSSPSGMELGWPSANLYFSTWGWQIAPYIKTYGIFDDPTAAPNPSSDANINFATLYSQFGYNYTYLSPIVGSAGSKQMPTGVPSTQGADLADTVVITSKWVFSDNSTGSAGLVWGTGFPSDTGQGTALTGPQGMLADPGSQSPDCDWIKNWCLSDWGAGGFFDNTASDHGNQPYPSIVDGRLTGGNAYRVANKTVVSWADGHAKSVPITGLAKGTDFNLNAASGQTGSAGYIDVTHESQYIWSLAKDCAADFPAGEVDPDTSLPACTQ